MAIFDEKKMEQKPVYPTKKTPSYADWALFRMGKELEESIPSGLTVDQEVIAGSENAVSGGAVKTYVDTEVAGVNEVPDSTTIDTGKVLTVDSEGNANWATPSIPQITVDQTVIADSTNPVAGGGVKTYVDTEVAGVNELPDSTASDVGRILTVDSNGVANWEDAANIAEQTVISGSTEPVSGGAVKNYVDTEIAGVNEIPTSTTFDEGKILSVDSNGAAIWEDVENITEQSVVSGSTEPVSGGAVKNYVDTEVAGINEVPASTAADANKVLTVDSNGNAIWQLFSSGGVTFHTFNTFGELKTTLKSLNVPFYLISYTNKLYTNYNINSSSGSIFNIYYRSETVVSSGINIYRGYKTIADNDGDSLTFSVSLVSIVGNSSTTAKDTSVTINISDIAVLY